MLAFHNDPAIKQKYLDRVAGHIKADRLIRGTGWDGFRGCAVGCTLENYDHRQYPSKLGIPIWLGELEDWLFEGMSADKAATWPYDFLVSIEPGDDVGRVKGPFLTAVLTSALSTFDHDTFPDVKTSIDASITLWQRTDKGSPEWSDAACAAVAAAANARRAARAVVVASAALAAAAAGAAAEGAALAAAAAGAAAEGAAGAAAAAAAAASTTMAGVLAATAHYDKFADVLINLLRENHG